MREKQKNKTKMPQGPTAESLRVKTSETGMDSTHWGTWLWGQLAHPGVNTVMGGNLLAYDGGSTAEEHPPLPAGVYSPEEVRQLCSAPLLCDRLRVGAVNGYVVRYLFDRRIIEGAGIRFSGAYLEDELFLIEYFSNSVSLAVVEDPLYYYYQNPMSVTKRYLPTFVDTFLTTLKLKADLTERYRIPVTEQWTDNTCWAGLLMAVGNEFAASNPASRREKCRRVKEICRLPVFAHALDHYVPQGMGRNKTIVAQLLRRRLFGPLSLLYAVKNRR